MRKQHARFLALDCQILNVGPDNAQKFIEYWREHELPFFGLADPDHRVSQPYGQAIRLLKLGRMPLQLVIDRDGVIVQRHDAGSMRDIPHPTTVLDLLEKL